MVISDCAIYYAVKAVPGRKGTASTLHFKKGKQLMETRQQVYMSTHSRMEQDWRPALSLSLQPPQPHLPTLEILYCKPAGTQGSPKGWDQQPLRLHSSQVNGLAGNTVIWWPFSWLHPTAGLRPSPRESSCPSPSRGLPGHGRRYSSWPPVPVYRTGECHPAAVAAVLKLPLCLNIILIYSNSSSTTAS